MKDKNEIELDLTDLLLVSDSSEDAGDQPFGNEQYLNPESVAMARYSIYIYHITPDEANRVRKELGLSELSEEWPAAGVHSHDPAP